MRPLRLSLEGFTSFRDKIDIDFSGLALFATFDTGREKIYYPRPKAPEIESNPNNVEPKETDIGPQSFKEQRRHIRYPTAGRNIQAKMILSDEVDIANMSVGGACIVTKRTISPGEKVLINIADENIDQPLKCKVIWESEGFG